MVKNLDLPEIIGKVIVIVHGALLFGGVMNQSRDTILHAINSKWLGEILGNLSYLDLIGCDR